MNLDLRLTDLPMPRIASIHLASATRILQRIAFSNRAKATQGGETMPFRNHKEKMKQRLAQRKNGDTFEQATNEVGRRSLLLSLYLQYGTDAEARCWLPAFDEVHARSVLGANGRKWNAGERNKATLLFFTHFSSLHEAGLSWFCARLIEAYGELASGVRGQVGRWHEHRNVLFSPTGDLNVAHAATNEEPLPSLMERFAVPSGGRFAECLRKVFLLNAIRDGPFGKEIPVLAEIESLKTERASASQLMGAAALQIMVQRVAKEGSRKWSGDWANWITRLGCDPRYGRATGEGAKWWGWATPDELRLAQQGIIGRDLRFFIEFLQRSLQGTDREPQFALRRRFLLGLFEAGKIESARLALNLATYERLDARYRDVWSVAHLSKTSDDTSMICLKCVDDVFVIEGTHSFGLRMFHKNFPILSFWEKPKRTYQDKTLRISPGECSLYLRHDPGGTWVAGFFRHLRYHLHVEWEDVRI